MIRKHNVLPSFYVNALRIWRKCVQGENLVGIKYITDFFNDCGHPFSFTILVERGIKQKRCLQWMSLMKAVRSKLYKNYNNVTRVSQDVQFYVGQKNLEKCNAKEIYNHILSTEYDRELIVPSISKYINTEESVCWNEAFIRIWGRVEYSLLECH